MQQTLTHKQKQMIVDHFLAFGMNDAGYLSVIKGDTRSTLEYLRDQN